VSRFFVDPHFDVNSNSGRFCKTPIGPTCPSTRTRKQDAEPPLVEVRSGMLEKATEVVAASAERVTINL
jgi:hypothetical protein